MPLVRQISSLSGLSKSTDRSSSSHVDAIDGLRAWAVLLVFGVHFAAEFAFTHRGLVLNKIDNASLSGVGDLILYWAFYSHYGVQIFFVISGFVITRSFMASATWSDYLTFLAHRVLRIYPAFLLSLALAIFVERHYAWIGSFSLPVLAQNLFFLNGAFALQIPAYNSVTWSLFFEFIYYIAFPALYLIALCSKRDVRRLGPLLWLIFVLGLWLTSFSEWFFFVSFLFGSWAGLQSDKTLVHFSSKLSDGYLLVAYLLVTTLACIFLPLPQVTDKGLVWPFWSPIFVLCLSVIAALAIVRVSHSHGILNRMLTSSPMLALGRISFSFFLVHVIVIGVIFQKTKAYANGSMLSAVALAISSFLVSVAFATVLYVLAERPYYLLRRRVGRRSP